METLYYPELTEDMSQIKITSHDELRHMKALRLKEGDNINITNGRGLTSENKIITINKNEAVLRVNKLIQNCGEFTYSLGLALGILDNKDRFEFAIEKGVELGMTDFYPLVTHFSQKKIINLSRLQAKIISAMKQCGRSVIPKIHDPVKINDLLKITDKFSNVVVADIDGNNPMDSITGNILCLVGPEGGFDKNELLSLENDKRTIKWNLGERRLRAETAGICILNIITVIHNIH